MSKITLFFFFTLATILISCINGGGNFIVYDYPSENNGWYKYENNPVFGDTLTGTIFDPYVFKQGDSLVMVASERKTGNIIRLTSIDGKKWGITNTMLRCKPNSWQHIVNRACVIRTDSVWHMYYTGQSPDTSRIGHAVSPDGYYFISDSLPILQSTLKQEGVSVMNPCVLYNHKRNCFQMWYAAGENYEPDVLFYAESYDGLKWNKRRNPVLEKNVEHEWEKAKVGGCYVHHDEKKYIMYYIGYQTVDIARICYATSSDGIHWQRTENNLLLSPSEGQWDADAVYKPSVLKVGKRIMLWYNGRKENKEYIGLAIKE